MMGSGLEERDSIFGRDNIIFSTESRPALGLSDSPVYGYQENFLQVKAAGS
jgi:hypothetical protein